MTPEESQAVYIECLKATLASTELDLKQMTAAHAQMMQERDAWIIVAENNERRGNNEIERLTAELQAVNDILAIASL